MIALTFRLISQISKLDYESDSKSKQGMILVYSGQPHPLIAPRMYQKGAVYLF